MRLSGVKVPRPASPFIIHKPPLRMEMAVAVSRGNVRNPLSTYGFVLICVEIPIVYRSLTSSVNILVCF
jgi:hypothetical protein